MPYLAKVLTLLARQEAAAHLAYAELVSRQCNMPVIRFMRLHGRAARKQAEAEAHMPMEQILKEANRRGMTPRLWARAVSSCLYRQGGDGMQ